MKLKIAIVGNYYPPYFVGGYELACKDTVAYLCAKGHKITVLCGHEGVSDKCKTFETGEYGEKIFRQLRYIDYKNPSFINKHIIEKYNFKTTNAHLHQYQPDIVYFWNMQSLSLAPVYAVQNAKVPRLFEMGDLWPKAYVKPGLSHRCKRLLKRLIPYTVGGEFDFGPCIVVSDWLATELQQRFKAHDISVIGNGTLVPKTTKINPGGKLRFLFAGRVCKEKGVEQAIRAFSEIKCRRLALEMTLSVVGPTDEKYRKTLLALIEKLGLKSSVSLHQQVTDMQNIYKNHDVLLMPTFTREPFGLVIIEAMAQGLVVIASNKYGPAEIIENETVGMLVDPENRIELNNAILTLVDNPALRLSIGEAAHRYVQKKYSMTVVKEQVEHKLLQVALKEER
ncbi:glycosyltransferase family 4 protein [bacterium AH-315-K03]|nr:glycosyltransferase family 4 protein [bacterium AH-315-K03]